MSIIKRRLLSLAVMAGMSVMLFAGGTYAQAPGADPKAEADSAFKAAEAAMTKGPAEIKLADQAVIRIAAGQTFIPSQEAGRLMKVMGNRAGEGLLGLVMPTGKEDWFVIARNIKAGYIKDNDARDWKADEFWKLALIAVVGFGALFPRFFGRKKA